MARRIVAQTSGDDPTDPAISIYSVSRTYGKPLNKWASILKEIEEEAPFRGQSYGPYRAAVIALLQGNQDAEDILNDGFGHMMEGVSAQWQKKIVRSMWKKSATAFDLFKEELAERFGKVHEVYEQPGYTNFVDFEDVPIKGRFHFSADFDDEHTHVYLIGGDWDELQTVAFTELLSVICEEAHGAERENVLMINMTLADPLIRPKASWKKLRKELLNEARNLRRLIRAISME